MHTSAYPVSKATAWLSLTVTLLLGACSSPNGVSQGTAGSAGQKNTPESFESDFPGSGARTGGTDAGANFGTGGSGGTANGAPTQGGRDAAARAIVEADIVQVSGNTLYALSRVAGLSVVDIADPAHLTMLGTFRELPGQPFEMYLRDGVIVAMYSNWGQYVRNPDGSYSFVQTSKVVALDVKKPSVIQKLGTFDVAGDVSDSRLVGDVLYVVGHENGYCWNCEQNKPQTSILSLDVKDVRAIRKVDQLRFGESAGYSWSRRSISVTTKRIYVAGPEYGSEQPTGSTIQVVDISNPSGDLVLGTSVVASGMIQSRWQMDEYQDVLRVVSQPWPWSVRGTVPPTVQTFKVTSAQDVKPLGKTNLVIPANETLQSARFDGPRGYAITAQRQDPLFTIDLSDPSQPKQVGELEMPGFVYYMEPRGNRLLGLGFDQGNPAGGITVTLFDVENLAQPKLLKRVNFGGDWGSLPEDQDRIHKAFKVSDELGLILVPFSGWSNWRNMGYCASTYRSGVQLVDLVGDDLRLRGMAPSRGQARRAILNGSKLLTVSDESVDSYDISQRDAPAALGQLTIARNVSRALPLANGVVARINEDWYASQDSTVDFVALGDVAHPERSLGEIKLGRLLSDDAACAYYTWVSHAFSHGTQLNISYQRYGSYDASKGYQQRTGLLSIDASDAEHPKVLSKLEWNTGYDQYAWWPFGGYYSYGYSAPQTSELRTETALVSLEARYRNYPEPPELRVRVIDLRDPTQPRATTLALPAAQGYAGLVQDGQHVLISHYQATTAGRARFYLNRLDLSDPSKPVLGADISVPGSLLHYDRGRGRFLTSELSRVVVENIAWEDCTKRFAHADYAYYSTAGGTGTGGAPNGFGTCTGYLQRLHLVRFVPGGAVRDDTLLLAEREQIMSSSLGDGRVVAALGHGYGGGWYRGWDCFGPCGYGYATSSDPASILTLGGFDTGVFVKGRLEVKALSDPWWGFWGSLGVYASGQRAIVLGSTDAAIVDAADPSSPKLLRTVALYSSAREMHASGNTVLLALGMNGVQRIDL
jgi:hypothetical protein